MLSLDATQRFASDERLLPAREEAVVGTPFEFREPRELGSLLIDDAFTDMTRTALPG